MPSPRVLRYTAFSADRSGGNPAGVILDAAALTPAEMQALAADIGYSESAFVTGAIVADASIPIRYFSPEAEIPFCGHATIATAAALADHVASGRFTLATPVGEVAILAEHRAESGYGSLESPPIGDEPLHDADLDELLGALRLSRADLHPYLPPAIGAAGNRHPVLVLAELGVLAALDYDFAALQSLCRAHDWVTVQLIAPNGPAQWRSRNPFPYGGVAEDPATGSAAAAFVGYLRALGQAEPGSRFTIVQGVEMGRTSTIDVEVLTDRARVSGPAVPLD